jgi:UDPglucose 6-dehydrogenase
LLTQWSEFRRLDLDRIKQAMHYPLLVDGRNLYDPAEMIAKGFFYQPIGRPPHDPNASLAAPNGTASASPAVALAQ